MSFAVCKIAGLLTGLKKQPYGTLLVLNKLCLKCIPDGRILNIQEEEAEIMMHRHKKGVGRGGQNSGRDENGKKKGQNTDSHLLTNEYVIEKQYRGKTK